MNTDRKPAKEILSKLRVRSGLQPTTHTLQDDPFVRVDFFFDREDGTFKVRLGWPPGKSKTVHLAESDVRKGTETAWRADATWRMTDECIERLAPGLDQAVQALALKGELR